LDEKLDGNYYLSCCWGNFYGDFRFKGVFEYLGLLAAKEDLGTFWKILAFDD